MENQDRATPRIPLPVKNPLPYGDEIQVNFCKMPSCSNFGVPARTTPGKTGPSQERDPCYTVINTARGRVPAIQCKSCREKPAIKSNEGISQELRRITRHLDTGIVSCPDEGCENHDKIYSQNQRNYKKFGTTETGNQRLRCKACLRTFTIEHPGRVRIPQLAQSVFLKIVNKAPMQRILEEISEDKDINFGSRELYRKIDLIYRRCLEFMSLFDRALIAGKYNLGGLSVSTDHQEYMTNWRSRNERRCTLLRAVASVENHSQYVFAVNVNYDKSVDAAEVNADALEIGDYAHQEAFRKYSRLWLQHDEYSPVRKVGAAAGIRTQGDLAQMIREQYDNVATRPDPEDGEGDNNKLPAAGMMVHQPYTTYAHFMLLERLLSGASRTLHCLDHESLLRAAYMVAFENKIRKCKSDAVFVSINKDYTVDERKSLRQKAEAEFRKLYRELLRHHSMQDAVHIRMEKAMRAAIEVGPWHDQWVKHPIPRMDEPEKAVCWLTGRGSLVDERAINLFLNSTMTGVDNFFMRIRRRLSLLERPIVSSSAHRVWYGYSPYNPAVVEKILKILQCYLNFCNIPKGRDGTPAMRLGIASKRYKVSEILTPSFVDKQAIKA